MSITVLVIATHYAKVTSVTQKFIFNILQPKTRPYFLHSGSQQVSSHSFTLHVTSKMYWLHWIISPVKVWITRNAFWWSFWFSTAIWKLSVSARAAEMIGSNLICAPEIALWKTEEDGGRESHRSSFWLSGLKVARLTTPVEVGRMLKGQCAGFTAI